MLEYVEELPKRGAMLARQCPILRPKRIDPGVIVKTRLPCPALVFPFLPFHNSDHVEQYLRHCLGIHEAVLESPYDRMNVHIIGEVVVIVEIAYKVFREEHFVVRPSHLAS